MLSMENAKKFSKLSIKNAKNLSKLSMKNAKKYWQSKENPLK